MNESKNNDTPDTPVGSHPQSARRSGRSYYYDDATGYEIYKPEEETEIVENENARASRNDADTQPEVNDPLDETKRAISRPLHKRKRIQTR